MYQKTYRQIKKEKSIWKVLLGLTHPQGWWGSLTCK